MRHDQILGEVIGYAVGAGSISLIFAFHRSKWIKKAHRLAASSNIELSSAIEGRVVRLLRQEYLSTIVMLIPTWIVTGAFVSGENTSFSSTRWYPWALVALPGVFILWSLLATSWPRWRGSGTHRLTHMRQLTPREAFTETERGVLWAGAAIAAVAASWGLWRVGAGVVWWIASLLSMSAAGLGLRWIAHVTMNQPSAAGDVLDLGWDDVLRFRRVRGLATGAALGFPVMIVVLDSLLALDLGRWRSLSLLPLLASIALVVGASQIFKQGAQMWRHAWVPPKNPQASQ